MRQILITIALLAYNFSTQSQDQTINGATFKTNGEVGIGTTYTGNGHLTINGTTSKNLLRLENDSYNDEASLRFRSKSNLGQTLHADVSLYATGSNQGFLGFKVPHNNIPNNGFDMIINHLGNIGIGTTTPSGNLEIKDSNPTLFLSTNDPNSNYQLKFTANYDYLNKFLLEYGNQVFIQEKVIDNVGGIGNSNSKLFLSNYYGIGFSTNTINPTNTNEVDLYISGSGNAIGSGNVGIGTTTPDEKLSVNGNIHTKEIRVDLTGWSDFVFEEDYDLPTLTEVENHIEENGHLKDIPSAAEVSENGILLGEMNAKLLQKIEELTLYTIEQEKEIENLKRKNVEFERNNNELFEIVKRLSTIESQLKNIIK